MAKRKAPRGTVRSSRKGSPDSRSEKRSKRQKSRRARRNETARSERRRLVAIRALRKGKSLAAAARSAGIPPTQFGRYLIKNRIARRIGKRWVFYKRGKREFLRFFSDGQTLRVIVTPETASAIGRYMSAVGQFLKTNDRDHLKAFAGQSIKDLSRKEHPFETRPNVLYRLNAVPEPFEEIYRVLT